MIEKAWKDADRNLVPRLFRAISKETVNHILPSEKSLNRQHEMEYHVMRLVTVLHDWRFGEHVTSERASGRMRRFSPACLSFRALSIPSILVAIDIIVVSLERTERSLTSAFFSDLLWKTWQTFKKLCQLSEEKLASILGNTASAKQLWKFIHTDGRKQTKPPKVSVRNKR